jgi:proline dehydrogenase
VFRLCTFKPLVRNAKSLLDLSNRILGRTLTSFVIKHSFFAHFCAGEDEAELQPTIQRLRSSGIGAILDFAAESDVAPEKKSSLNVGASGSTTSSSSSPTLLSKDSFEHKEHLKENFEHSLLGVELAGRALMSDKGAAAKPGSGFAAIKLTSFARPELLQVVTSTLRKHEELFVSLALASQTTPESGISNAAFVRFFKTRPSGKDLKDDQLNRIFNAFDSCRDGVLDKIEFTDALSMVSLGPIDHAKEIERAATGSFDQPLSVLSMLGLEAGQSEDLRNEWAEVNDRMFKIAEAAAKGNVTVMVDAEQTYLQLAINSVTMKAQRQFNRPASCRSTWVDPSLAHARDFIAGKSRSNQDLPNSQSDDVKYAVVYSTLQAYLTAAPSRLQLALERSNRENFIFGTKLVRGAYMIQERKRALDFGYADPIQTTISATHACYDSCAETLAKASLNGGARVMAATHNEASVIKLVTIMKNLGGDTSNISFGQLLGMCDYVSFSLGAANISVHKYVPYGPVLEVVPYLIRRAQENSDILGGVGKELRLIQSEISRRIFSR